jgi:hypothetical protein
MATSSSGSSGSSGKINIKLPPKKNNPSGTSGSGTSGNPKKK